MVIKKEIQLSFFGFFAGFISSLLGMGPGMILVSSLHFISKFDLKKSALASLFLLIPISTSSLLSHFQLHKFEILNVYWIFSGCFIGILLGNYLRSFISDKKLKWIFILFLASVLVKQWIGLGFINTDLSSYSTFGITHLITGFCSSLIASLLGIGGGVVISSIYVSFLSFSIKDASLVAIFASTLNACLSTILNYKLLFWTKDLTFLLVFSLIGSFLGAQAWGIISEPLMKLFYGCFLLFILIKMIRSLLK